MSALETAWSAVTAEPSSVRLPLPDAAGRNLHARQRVAGVVVVRESVMNPAEPVKTPLFGPPDRSAWCIIPPPLTLFLRR